MMAAPLIRINHCCLTYCLKTNNRIVYCDLSNKIQNLKVIKMAEIESHVEIGYLEKSEPFKLESRFFPSKVGGKPAWLDLQNISVDVSCGVCGKPCIFLCQLYAPIENQRNAYHRTIYIFVCRNPACCDVNKSDNFVVFRCQLPKENNYYAPEEPTDTSDWHPESRIDRFNPVCIVCGCLGLINCEKCKTTWYCSEEHKNWESGRHELCESNESNLANLLFPEYEILTEREIPYEERETRKEKSDEEKIKEYEELLREGKSGTLNDVPVSVLEQFVESKEDKYFKKFKLVLSLTSDQVVRYDRGGQPLWIAKPNLPKERIPNCQFCQSSRQFEFQILPTLLSYLHVDSLAKSIDWGTLMVYTCKKNCEQGPAYKTEFLWKQDVL